MMRDGARELVSALEMLGNLRRYRIRPRCPGRFQTGADASITQRASRRRQPFIEQFAVKVVTEGVVLDWSTVRPGACAGRDDEHALAREPAARGLDRDHVRAERSCDGRRCKLATDDARCAQEIEIVRVKIVNLPVDKAPYAVRNRIDVGRR